MQSANALALAAPVGLAARPPHADFYHLALRRDGASAGLSSVRTHPTRAQYDAASISALTRVRTGASAGDGDLPFATAPSTTRESIICKPRVLTFAFDLVLH